MMPTLNKTQSKKKRSKYADEIFPLALLAILLVVLVATTVSCTHENILAENRQPSAVTLLLSASDGSINSDLTLWEDRVDEVRMVVFTGAGNVVYNEMLNFPNGFAERSKAVRLQAGVYDFLFIANETAVGNDEFRTALIELPNKATLSTDVRFRSLSYNPEFRPDGVTPYGRFLMSASYNDVPVLEGGTEDNPLPLTLPTGVVALVRSLAKVEVVFRKKDAGSTVPDDAVTSLQLNNVALQYAVPGSAAAYTGTLTDTDAVVPTHFNYATDSIGAVTWYVPELIGAAEGEAYTRLLINNNEYPVELSAPHSIERNNLYTINAYVTVGGGLELSTCVTPWSREDYKYMFQDDGHGIVTPPVTPTDSSLIVPTDCGKIEIRSTNEVLQQGLMGAYGDQINWWDPVLQGPTVVAGSPPYYCEKKYGKGWRLISSCELMSFLTLFDRTYRIWQSNTWQGVNSGLEYSSLPLRQEAQALLQKLTGVDMSRFVPTDNGKDDFGGEKLGMLDQYFTPGDVLIKESDYPDGWPFMGKVNNNGQAWYPMEVVVQLKGYWYAEYLDFSLPENYDKILYQEFNRFDYSSTTSRCVRSVE